MRQTLQKLNIRLAALAIAVVLLISLLPVAMAAEHSGKCGKELSWSLEGGILTITGSGDMTDYRERTLPPWYECRDEITAIRLPDGLTSIGDMAFAGCTALTSVDLPDSVKDVGWHAFDGCTSLVLLNLGKVRSIGEAAFRDCVSLVHVRLPGTLTTLNYQAFYRCESLREVAVPTSVTRMGMTVFAYCYSLIRAEIRAEIETLPDWTFYGCGNLTEVALPNMMTGTSEYAFYGCESVNIISYSGSKENQEKLREDISEDIDSNMISFTQEPLENTSVGTAVEETETETITTTTTTTTTENGNITTEVTVTTPVAGSSKSEVQVDIVLENQAGWEEVRDYLDSALLDGTTQADVNIYMKDNAALPGEVLTTLAGESNSVTVQTSSGSIWKVEGTQLKEEIKKENFDFSHTRRNATPEQLEKLGGIAGFQVLFNQSAEINAQVLIRLPIQYTRCIATLYQVDGNDLTLLQSVVVDNIGYAHFYLGAVDKDTEYLIGINVPGISEDDLIIPEELYEEYGITDLQSPIEYVITGRTSSWGLSGTQVTLIFIGVFVVCVAAVGGVMFTLNKRKLKMGYVPDLDDEDGE